MARTMTLEEAFRPDDEADAPPRTMTLEEANAPDSPGLELPPSPQEVARQGRERVLGETTQAMRQSTAPPSVLPSPYGPLPSPSTVSTLLENPEQIPPMLGGPYRAIKAAQSIPKRPISGTVRTLGGLMETAAPLAIPALAGSAAAAPIVTAVDLALGTAAGYGGQWAASALGADPETAEGWGIVAGFPGYASAVIRGVRGSRGARGAPSPDVETPPVKLPETPEVDVTPAPVSARALASEAVSEPAQVLPQTPEPAVAAAAVPEVVQPPEALPDAIPAPAGERSASLSEPSPILPKSVTPDTPTAPERPAGGPPDTLQPQDQPTPPVPPASGGPPKPPPANPNPSADAADPVKNRSRVAYLFADNLYNLRRQGPVSRQMEKAFEQSLTRGKGYSGHVHESLNNPGGDKKFGIATLTPEEDYNAFQVAQGTAKPMSPRVQAVTEEFRKLSDWAASMAEERGVMTYDANSDQWRPFSKLQNWAPHKYLRGGDLEKGALRDLTVKNMVDEFHFTPEHAGQFLDEMVRLEADADGKYRPDLVIQWLKNTGQADDKNVMRVLDIFRPKPFRSSSLEYARTLNMPHYVPSAKYTFPRTLTNEVSRLAWIENFGQELPEAVAKDVFNSNQFTKMLKKMVTEENWDEKALNQMFGDMTGSLRGSTGLFRDLDNFLSSLVALKMGKAAIMNMLQPLNNAVAAGPKHMVKGFKNLLPTKAGRAGRIKAEKTGALFNTARAVEIGEPVDATRMANFTDAYMKWTGNTGTELANRWQAVAAGDSYIQDMTRWLAKGGARTKHAKNMLRELRAPEEVIQGKRPPDYWESMDMLQRFDRKVNFSNDPAFKPAWASREWSEIPLGKWLWRLHTYPYNMTRLVFNETIRKLDPRLLRSDPLSFAKGVRNALLMYYVYPIPAEGVMHLKAYMDDVYESFLRGEEVDDRQARLRQMELEKEAEYNIRLWSASGVLGEVGNVLEGKQYGDSTAETASGVVLGSGFDLADAALSERRGEQIPKVLGRQLGPFAAPLTDMAAEKIGEQIHGPKKTRSRSRRSRRSGRTR